MQVIQVQTRRLSSRVDSTIRKGISVLTTQFTNRYGVLGVNGKYFHLITTSRELVETAYQTVQAYRMSRLLPSTLLNRFYVTSLVLNYWSPAIIYALLFWRDEVRKRFASLVSDCALDLLACMGVTFIVVLSYVRQYDPETTDFGVNPWYNDEWTAQALNEFQMVLVVSWSDLASRAIFSLGLLMTTTSMKELLYPAPRHGNRVMDFSESSLEISRALKVKSSSNPEPPSVRLLPGKDDSKTDTREIRRRMWEFAMNATHFLFFVWGIIVLGLHIQSSVQPSLQQCTLQVRPWAVSTPYCFLVSLDCHRLNISGRMEEVDDKWREFDGSTAVMMIIKHCPLLDVPDRFNDFHQIISIKVYNSTIVE